jgi:hypothetical protein
LPSWVEPSAPRVKRLAPWGKSLAPKVGPSASRVKPIPSKVVPLILEVEPLPPRGESLDARVNRFPRWGEPFVGKVAGRAGSAGSELLSDDPPQSLLQRLPFPSYVLPQGVVEKSLVISTTRSMDLVFEPLDEIVVEANRDAGLPRGGRNDRSSLRLTEVVFFSHRLLS